MRPDMLLLAIRAQMTEQGISPYKLAQMLRGRVSQATIYNYVKNGKSAKSDTVVEIMTVLGLIVTVGKEVSRGRRTSTRQHV